MDILEMIRKRRSIREFEDRAVPDEAMDDLVEALRWAPSAGNLQSRFFYFVLNETLRQELAEAAYAQDFIAQAPLVVVACADRRIAHTYGRRGTDLYMIQDASASLQNLLLVAHERGLGAVWVGSFDEERVRSLLDIPDDLRPVALVPVGWPAEKPSPRSRVPRDHEVKIVR
jgi:nitroreductase